MKETRLTPAEKVPYLKCLMYIKSTSEKHLSRHNIILDFDLQTIKGRYSERTALEDDIRCAFHENNFLLKKEDGLKEDGLKEEELDAITKRVLHCGYLSREPPPSKFYLFTVPEMVKKYEDNVHFKTLRNTIELKTGKDALELVNTYWRKYIQEKQASK